MDSRFPIGPLTLPERRDRSALAAYAASLRRTAAQLREAAAFLSAEQLECRYAPGSWTARQLVHHVADAHEQGFLRFRAGLTAEAPAIAPFDQDAWSRLADYALAPTASLAIFEGVSERFAAVLEALDPADLEREIVHPGEGRQTLWRLLAKHEWHPRHHLAQLRLALSQPV